MRVYNLTGPGGSLEDLIASFETENETRLGNIGNDAPTRRDGSASLEGNNLKIVLYEESDGFPETTSVDQSSDAGMLAWFAARNWVMPTF